MKALPLLLVSAVAWADPVEITLHNQVPAGQKPTLTVKALQPLRGLQLELAREDDGRKFTATSGTLREGQSAALAVGDGRAGRARWKGSLVALFPDGNRFTTGVTFESVTDGAGGGLTVTYRRDHLDLDTHVLEFQLSRPAASAELTVYGEDGAELGSGAATYKGEPPGTWLRVGWTQQPGNLLRLELRAVAVDGQATRVKLLPWSVRIPHEEVVFASGESTIAPSEEAKLDVSYQRIIAAVATARRADPSLPIKVYIAGHTDTVGKPDDNRRLSLARARAIAQWFKKRGLPLPLYCAGFGEDALKVKTPDETDEAANRRADYIVGLEEPQIARNVRPSFTPLR
jgi:outer membrane protein OmpA-like peptidoglycan-associated protein